MKVSQLILMAALAAMAARADVEVGDSYQQVVDELGEPKGEIKSGSYQLLSFDRGRVELHGGKVAKIELISVAEDAKKKAVREKQRVEAARIAAESREKRIEDGTAVRRAKLADQAFMTSSAADRVAFWQNFKKLYPEVPLGDEYTTALHELEQEYAAQRVERARQQQIADLEQRAADAEARARRAEQRSATVVGNELPLGYYSYTPGFNYYYPWSYIQHNSDSRQSAQFKNAAPPPTSSGRSPFRSEYTAPPYLVTPFSGGGISFSVNTR